MGLAWKLWLPPFLPQHCKAATKKKKTNRFGYNKIGLCVAGCSPWVGAAPASPTCRCGRLSSPVHRGLRSTAGYRWHIKKKSAQLAGLKGGACYQQGIHLLALCGKFFPSAASCASISWFAGFMPWHCCSMSVTCVTAKSTYACCACLLSREPSL